MRIPGGRGPPFSFMVVPRSLGHGVTANRVLHIVRTGKGWNPRQVLRLPLVLWAYILVRTLAHSPGHILVRIPGHSRNRFRFHWFPRLGPLVLTQIRWDPGWWMWLCGSDMGLEGQTRNRRSRLSHLPGLT